jgi:hypothetical protein
VIFGGQFEPDRNDRGPSAPTDEHGLDPEAQSAMQSPETFLQAFTDVEPSEIQSLGAERAAITVETLIAEAEAARSKAMREKGGANAAVAAITAKAKLAGLWRKKVAQTDPSGENARRYFISDHVMSPEEWLRACGGE